MKWLERAELLFKTEGIAQLQNAHVLVVGLGGVGSYAAEFLARAGIGTLTIIDGDVVDITNINRQLIALQSTVGKPKIEVMQERLRDINPYLNIQAHQLFLEPDMAYSIIEPKYNYVLDCIDSLSPKLSLLAAAKRKHVKIVSSMGAGGKYDPSKVSVKDISQSTVCPLAKFVRKRLKAEGISKGIKVVFSTEIPDKSSLKITTAQNFKKSFYGTNSWMPCYFGLLAASTAVRHLLKKKS